ncbi:MAG: hypothetical protein K0S97_2292 [Chloroflexota bacterium]|jgi:hypothetical protein|nr:hypothetical protein [Chloroflexota bacterium]
MTATDRGSHGIQVLVDAPITFETEDGTIVHSPMIHARVGGVGTRLILDTGSTDHVLTKELIDRVGVDGEPADDGTDHAGAAVPSWSVGDLEVRVAKQPFALHDVVAIAGPPPFARWGIGGFLSPQHLHPGARVLIDLLNDRLVVVGSSKADVDGWLIGRVPSLRPIVLDRVADEPTVAVPAAIEPFATVSTMLNTGGRQTEFARGAVPGLRGSADGRGGTGVGGGRVVGSDVGECVLLVGDARIPVPRLVVRDEMDDPPGLVGQDVLRGTALICSEDPDRGVVWLVPRDVGIRVGHERFGAPSDS